MEIKTAYRLTFKTQLHLGRDKGPAQEGSLGLEKTETYIPADTLFSALCQTWATFYDTDSLTGFLEPYVEDSETLPFMLTSVFPYADNVYFFPIPLTFHRNENTPDDFKKEIKKVQFISESIFQRIISDESPDFDKDNLINGENVWVSADEKKQLNKVMGNTPIIWETTTRPRVTIGAQNSGSEIWHVQTVQFNTNCGLWFAANFDSDETKQKVETLLRILGDSGIGGERSAGYGQFDFHEVQFEIPAATEAGSKFVTLSPICPKTQTQLEQLLTDEAAYAISPLNGWVSTPGTHTCRKLVNMFAEGSVLHTSNGQIGQLVDLKQPDCPHPVHRYGYAWQVGVGGNSDSR